jgi:formylglycine-generating enzyme required for sulfatase activity
MDKVLILVSSLWVSLAVANFDAVYERLEKEKVFTALELKALKTTLAGMPMVTQGTEVTKHPVSREQCQKTHEGKPWKAADPACHAANMVSIPGTNACVDQFEFPNLSCEYPMVWISPIQAHKVCQSIGKRLCDAGEWESACAGEAIKDPYVYGKKGESVSTAHQRQKREINANRQKKWAYGDRINHGICATKSQKSPDCDKANATGKNVRNACGSNTYPAGMFPACAGPLGVYDIHGNAAEHMNLPLFSDKELTANGGVGYTEMKGSWFVAPGGKPPHEDDCRWRAPYWHGSKIDDKQAHHNYHLGFRCCKTKS